MLSMTGFGAASGEYEDFHLSVEIRSLNNRYLKVNLRLPDELQSQEAFLETLLRKYLSRGSITLTAKIRLKGELAAYEIDEAVLSSYASHLESLQSRLGHLTNPSHGQTGNGHATPVELTSLLGMPGVLKPSSQWDHFSEKIEAPLSSLVNEACKNVIAMRAKEGQTIVDELVQFTRFMREKLQTILDKSPQVVQDYQNRLKQRIHELIQQTEIQAEEYDVIHEVAVFAERVDIAEEVSRFNAHLDQVEALAAKQGQEPVGRTLDFLAQELLREANTMGSKCNDAEIAKAVVQIKGVIDRLKEQAQNVL